MPVKEPFGIVRELNTPEIEIEVDDKNTCSVRSGASFYKINGLSADEFPPLPKFKEDKKVTLPQEKVRGMMKKTSFAISSDESLPRPERHFHQPQGTQNDHGRHRWPPLGAGG